MEPQSEFQRLAAQIAEAQKNGEKFEDIMARLQADSQKPQLPADAGEGQTDDAQKAAATEAERLATKKRKAAELKASEAEAESKKKQKAEREEAEQLELKRKAEEQLEAENAKKRKEEQDAAARAEADKLEQKRKADELGAESEKKKAKLDPQQMKALEDGKPSSSAIETPAGEFIMHPPTTHKKEYKARGIIHLNNWVGHHYCLSVTLYRNSEPFKHIAVVIRCVSIRQGRQ